MKQFTLPHTDITAPNVVLGLMRIAEKSDEEIRELNKQKKNAMRDSEVITQQMISQIMVSVSLSAYLPLHTV